MILDKKENDYFSFFFLQPDICQKRLYNEGR